MMDSSFYITVIFMVREPKISPNLIKAPSSYNSSWLPFQTGPLNILEIRLKRTELDDYSNISSVILQVA